MKNCPRCGLKYADDTMQFCLTDGTQLLPVSLEIEEPPTIVSGESTQTASAPNLPKTSIDEVSFATAATTPRNANLQSEPSESHVQPNTSQNVSVNRESNSDDISAQILTFAPIVVALMQNYWQWLYMTRFDSFQFPAFLLSVDFYVWLLLLVGGAVLCIFALQRGKNKGFAIVGLVILGINFLLCLVPRSRF